MTPPDRHAESPIDPAGVADLWHPSKMHRTNTDLPEVSAALRPPATICQPCGLVTLHILPTVAPETAATAGNGFALRVVKVIWSLRGSG